jgi:hypothetical protein
MTHYLFITESYPFTADLAALLGDAAGRATLITRDVHLSMTAEQLALFEAVVPVPRFDLESIEAAVAGCSGADARIVSHDDFFYDLFARINERRGLQGYSLASILPFVDKACMKERLAGSGIRVPRFAVFDADAHAHAPEAYVERLGRQIGYPMFAKPLRGAGAEHCAFLPSARALSRWCAQDKGGLAFEIDEYIGDAVLYHCDTVIKGGKAAFTQACRYSRPCADFAKGFMVGSYTLAEDDPSSRELCAFAAAVLAAFARHSPAPDGVTHMEMFRTAKGEIVFLEVQFRPPGANVRTAYGRHLGANLEDFHLGLQMGRDMTPPGAGGPHAAWLYFPTAEGIVAGTNPLPPLSSEIVEAVNYLQQGQRTHAPSSILDARGRGVVALSLVIANADHARLRADFERLCGHRPFTLAEEGSRVAQA